MTNPVGQQAKVNFCYSIEFSNWWPEKNGSEAEIQENLFSSNNAYIASTEELGYRRGKQDMGESGNWALGKS